ncbi:MAG: undecaprenyldiphospho-muramoylpentapeptide beta-N-acetylglucosaminyltransferase [Alistipes sp.]|nr:undecaprenyldiphospho-muramoylpentapeptide beta-N-acetylglucosaminyltransferase [Alistipes sp.]
MKRIILSGGGTGGHIYPAVAVAEALKRKFGEDVEILFVGAEGKMEMEKIPALGYRIEGLTVVGIQRKLTLSNIANNLTAPFKVLKSIRRAKHIISEFNADIVVGFGGYASAPVLKAAQKLGIPTIIQEQNSYAGLTNKMLAKRARRICVAYDNMDRFFPAERIVMTGNPLRGRFSADVSNRDEALAYYGMNNSLPVIMVVGGSLGTRTLNEMMKKWILTLNGEAPVQVIWQTGKFYEREMQAFLKEHPTKNIWQGAFIDRMDYAYAAADVVISRSGACTVSELCLVAKPTIFVPSPNVSEDHQTKNAMALVNKGAAAIVPDSEAVERGMAVALDLVNNREQLEALRSNIAKLAISDAAERVVKEIESELEKAL